MDDITEFIRYSMTPEHYVKRCSVILKLVSKKYENHGFCLVHRRSTPLQELLIDGVCTITLMPDNSLKEITRHVDKKIERLTQCVNVDKCIICDDIIATNVTCTKCANNWCGDCYINLFKSGKGVIKCPHCRFSFGMEMSEEMVEMGIIEIKLKIGAKKEMIEMMCIN